MERQLGSTQSERIPGISKAFSFVVAVLPILASYASGIPGFSVADICLALFVGLSMFAKGSNNEFKVRIGSLVIGLIVLITFTIFACLLDFPISVSDVVIRTIRYCFYIAALFTAGKKILDIPSVIKYIKIVSVIASWFILLQMVVYNTSGVIIKGYFSFLDLYTEQYSETDYGAIYEQLKMYRPTSFFLEPAHYARYCIIGLILLLFDDAQIDNKMIAQIAICMLGIIISTSSQGYFLLAIIAGMFLLTRIKNVKSYIFRVLLYVLVLLLPLLMVYLLQNPVIVATIDRTFSGGIADENTAIGERLGGFLLYFELPFINKLIGTGFGNVPEGAWLSSGAYWLYGSGIIVFLIYVYFLIQTFFQLDRKRKYILFVVAFLFITDDSFYSYMIVLYFSLILFRSKRSKT